MSSPYLQAQPGPRRFYGDGLNEPVKLPSGQDSRRGASNSGLKNSTTVSPRNNNYILYQERGGEGGSPNAAAASSMEDQGGRFYNTDLSMYQRRMPQKVKPTKKLNEESTEQINAYQ